MKKKMKIEKKKMIEEKKMIIKEWIIEEKEMKDQIRNNQNQIKKTLLTLIKKTIQINKFKNKNNLLKKNN